jgi:hypothetical protein
MAYLLVVEVARSFDSMTQRDHFHMGNWHRAGKPSALVALETDQVVRMPNKASPERELRLAA